MTSASASGAIDDRGRARRVRRHRLRTRPHRDRQPSTGGAGDRRSIRCDSCRRSRRSQLGMPRRRAVELGTIDRARQRLAIALVLGSRSIAEIGGRPRHRRRRRVGSTSAARGSASTGRRRASSAVRLDCGSRRRRRLRGSTRSADGRRDWRLPTARLATAGETPPAARRQTRARCRSARRDPRRARARTRRAARRDRRPESPSARSPLRRRAPATRRAHSISCISAARPNTSARRSHAAPAIRSGAV